MSEHEWYFEYRYGPLMDPFEDEGLFEIKVSEIEFLMIFHEFLARILDAQSPEENSDE